MAKDTRTFFERLTGTVRMNEEAETKLPKKSSDKEAISWIEEETDKDAELTVDIYQTSDMIIIKSMIAGVRPEDLDISITRDMVTINGKREEERSVKEEDYYVRELYWGSFSRSIQLPEEIDVDEAEAVEKHGLLILKLPKLDKKKQARLKVKTV